MFKVKQTIVIERPNEVHHINNIVIVPLSLQAPAVSSSLFECPELFLCPEIKHHHSSKER